LGFRRRNIDLEFRAILKLTLLFGAIHGFRHNG
jgi:hypothetical protein